MPWYKWKMWLKDINKSEAYILAAPIADSKLYHLILDGLFMLSTHLLVLDISNPKVIY